MSLSLFGIALFNIRRDLCDFGVPPERLLVWLYYEKSKGHTDTSSREDQMFIPLAKIKCNRVIKTAYWVSYSSTSHGKKYYHNRSRSRENCSDIVQSLQLSDLHKSVKSIWTVSWCSLHRIMFLTNSWDEIFHCHDLLNWIYIIKVTNRNSPVCNSNRPPNLKNKQTNPDL